MLYRNSSVERKLRNVHSFNYTTILRIYIFGEIVEITELTVLAFSEAHPQSISEICIIRVYEPGFPRTSFSRSDPFQIRDNFG